MAEVFPSTLIRRENPNLRLGIKSSLNSFKQIIASLYTIYSVTDFPSDVHYSEEFNNTGFISIHLASKLKEAIQLKYAGIANICDEIETSPLFKSQIEALQVGIELFLRLGKISFAQNSKSERTGRERYEKILYFSDKMRVLDAYLSAFPAETVNHLLESWLKGQNENSRIENGFKQILSTFIIDCCYKIKRSDGAEIIFNLENVYKVLEMGNNVIVKDRETVGPMRVLNSYIDEGMLPDIQKFGNVFTIAGGKNEELKKNSSMISISLDLKTRSLPYDDIQIEKKLNGTTTDNTFSLIHPYLSALRTKPFLLLAGISGTGKSRIVREFAFKSCPPVLQDKDGTSPGNYCMVEVKPNWHDSTELLGYWSNLQEKYVFTKFVKFLVKAKMYPEVPFFVCLDEMNLAPVEQYFAEFLSVVETRKNVDGEIKSGVLVDKEYFRRLASIPNTKNTVTGEAAQNLRTDKDIYKGLYGLVDEDCQGIDKTAGGATSLLTEGLTLPENVFVIGTVNMDDTTHQFSRKVIDRAMTIEMNGGALEDIFKDEEGLAYSEKPLTMDNLRSKYVTAKEVIEKCTTIANDNRICDYIQGKDGNGLPQRLQEINRVLAGTPFTVSYRVMNELTIYLAVLLDTAAEEDKEISFDTFMPYVETAIDKILLMKILPRVEGDDEMFRIPEKERRVNGLDDQVNDEDGKGHEFTKLDWLKQIAPQHTEDNKEEYMAVDKLSEMIDRLERQSFTRYWP